MNTENNSYPNFHLKDDQHIYWNNRTHELCKNMEYSLLFSITDCVSVKIVTVRIITCNISVLLRLCNWLDFMALPNFSRNRPRPPSYARDEVDRNSMFDHRESRRNRRDRRTSLRSRDGRENRLEHRRDSQQANSVGSKKPPVKRCQNYRN